MATAQIDTHFRLGLADLKEQIERPATRRQLNADEANALIEAWKFGRRGREPLGECWAYLGWTPEELEHFKQTGETPRGG